MGDVGVPKTCSNSSGGVVVPVSLFLGLGELFEVSMEDVGLGPSLSEEPGGGSFS